MRGFIARGLVALGMLSLSAVLPAVAASTSAPADEYFGRYHLSILGIRNAIHDMTIKAEGSSDHKIAYLNSAVLAEDAIHQWQSKYPQDEWLPKMIFSLERLYITIGAEAGAEHAVATAAWLGHSYPGSAYAKMGRGELAKLSTSDDGTETTKDSPAVLGMVPALSDTTLPPTTELAQPTSAVAVTASNNAR